jgi:hypothetical protein
MLFISDVGFPTGVKIRLHFRRGSGCDVLALHSAFGSVRAPKAIASVAAHSVEMRDSRNSVKAG